jgi:hypothetical protein
VPTDNSDAKVLSGIFWPLLVVLLLGGHASIMLVAMTFALADPPELVTESYYQEAVEWDQQQRAAPALPAGSGEVPQP